MSKARVTMYDFADSTPDETTERVFAVAWVGNDDGDIVIEFDNMTDRRARMAKEAIEKGLAGVAIPLPTVEVHLGDLDRARLLHSLLGDAIAEVEEARRIETREEV